MIHMEDGVVFVDDKPMVNVWKGKTNYFTKRLPACSIGTWLEVLSWMREKGLEAE